MATLKDSSYVLAPNGNVSYRNYVLGMSQLVFKQIPYNKEGFQEMYDVLLERFKERTAIFGEEEVKRLQSDERNLRTLLIRQFGQQVFNVFYSADGSGKGSVDLTSIENITFFYHYYKNLMPESIEMVEAVTALLTQMAFEHHISLLNKTVSRNSHYIDASKANLTGTLTEWKKCPTIFKGFMKNFSLANHEMYTGHTYTFDVGNIPVIRMIQVLSNCSYAEAEKFVLEEGSVLCKQLTPETEAFLLKSIVFSPTPTMRGTLLDGYAVKGLISYEEKEKEQINSTSNLYTREIHPYLINIVGEKMVVLEQALRAKGNIDEVAVYQLTERGFSFTTTKPLEQLVSSDVASLFSPLTGLSLKYEGKLI